MICINVINNTLIMRKYILIILRKILIFRLYKILFIINLNDYFFDKKILFIKHNLHIKIYYLVYSKIQ